MTRVLLSQFRASKGCVVSYCPVASAVGARVLRDGGNAIDATVATSLALAVTYPQAGNLGGGGFMLIRRPDKSCHFLDYRETAPAEVDASQLLDEDGVRSEEAIIGGAPVCVPGTVAGLYTALERFGTMSWADLINRSLQIAESGYWLTTRQSAFLGMYHDTLTRFAPSKRAFYGDNGEPPPPGVLYKQPMMARSLRMLANGPDAFYRGEIAEAIVETVNRFGGQIQMSDLAGYQAKWREPLRGSFLGREIVTAGFPSAGGVVVKTATEMLERAGLMHTRPDSPSRYLLLARVMRIAFELQRELAVDPDFAPPDHIAQSENQLRRCIEMASDLTELESILELEKRETVVDPGAYSRNTTHLSAVDASGNSVSNTYSLNTLFGSRLVPEGHGFLLNNTLDDFSIEGTPNYYGILGPQQNILRPGSRAVGSMSPTFAIDADGEVELNLGAAGGPRIPSVVTQLIIRVLGDGEIFPSAMRAPRLHQHDARDEVWVERNVREDIRIRLREAGRLVTQHNQLGIAAGIQKHEHGLYAALDFRFSN